jgi:HrpA-like RNA helicase
MNAEFPVEPRLSKVLLSSLDFLCTEEVLTVVAMLQVQNLWANPKGRSVSQGPNRRSCRAFHTGLPWSGGPRGGL